MREAKETGRARGNLAVRFSVAERHLLEAASAARPKRLTTYIREVALEAARRELTLTNGAPVGDPL